MGNSARVIVTVYLDSAHKLPEDLTKEGLTTLRCCNLHGHTYKVQIGVRGDPEANIIVDFGRIKRVLSCLDHVFLNAVFEAMGWNVPTTAENLCNFVHMLLLRDGIEAHDITIWEGYKGSDTNMVKKIYD